MTFSNYGEMETDIAIPLAQHTAELKAERLRLMNKLSVMTSQIRQLFDSLHPGVFKCPARSMIFVTASNFAKT